MQFDQNCMGVEGGGSIVGSVCGRDRDQGRGEASGRSMVSSLLW